LCLPLLTAPVCGGSISDWRAGRSVSPLAAIENAQPRRWPGHRQPSRRCRQQS
jgi:hypothetical protein